MNIDNECFVCTEPYNRSNRKRILCLQYNKDKKQCCFAACRECVRKYILQSGTTAQCMSCKNQLNRDFMIEHLCRNWVDKEYQKYVSTILLNVEKSKCPENMQEVENYKKIDLIEKDIKELSTKIRMMYKEIHSIRETIAQKRNIIQQYRLFQLTPLDKKNKKKFIRKCPLKDCKGFLSQQWRCGLCQSNICKDCMEICDDKKEHKCDENKKKSISLLNKDTKPCPKCGEMIMKIDGCDQMWCPSCKNAWNWKTGSIVNGVIHNPHYYEYQRQINNGVIPRVLGDVPCGGLPGYQQWRIVYNYFPLEIKERQKLRNIHRNILHFQDVIIRPMIQEIRELKDNKSLRIRYMLGKTSQDECKSMISHRYSRHHQLESILNVYQLYNTVVTENIMYLFRYLTEADRNQIQFYDEIKQFFKKVNNARLYVNKELYKVSFTYKRTVRIIETDFNLRSIVVTSRIQLDKLIK